ncbi:MAG: mannose-6-phosphate isomerase [Microbacteriaceae bacterium]|nr:mannose-6-phosphate isomerase [Microbacteriaceae bacterium]
MFVGITNTPRPYAWGSRTAISDLLGTQPSGEPEAELWLGAHPGSPSIILDSSQTGGAKDLAEWIANDPHTTLGPLATDGRLPFLLKVLAAASPLSLQAHPTPEQAIDGFGREDKLGVPLAAGERNYKDAYPKPELIYALSPTFDALCGFRPLDETLAIVSALIDLDMSRQDPQPQPLEDLYQMLAAPDGLRTSFEWLISRQAGVATLVGLVTELAGSSATPPLAIARALASEYPGDPGIVISLLINGVTLASGEALYLPAGNIHAYLEGLGIELMTASDNVLRGGLTTKHIDVPELVGVLDFTPVPVPYLRASKPADGVEVFQPDDADFALVRISASEIGDSELDASYPLGAPGIVICTAGSIAIAGAESSVTLERGESVYVTPSEGSLAFSGSGTAFLATIARAL